MFLCRQLLLRVNTPKHISTPFLSRRLLSKKNSRTLLANNDDVIPADTEPVQQQQSYDANASGHSNKRRKEKMQKVESKGLDLDGLLPSYPWTQPFTPGRPFLGASLYGVPQAKKFKAVDSYEILRTQDTSAINRMPLQKVIDVAKNACKAGRSSVLDHIASDMVEVFGGSEADRSHATLRILELAAPNNLLSNCRLLALLQVLHSNNALSKLSTTTIACVLQSLLVDDRFNKELPHNLPIPILLDLLPIYLRRKVHKGPALITYRPPHVVELAYGLVDRLLGLRRDKEALEVFQVLVDTNNIPTEAIQEANKSSMDPKFIILSTLAYSCLHYGWRRTAVTICKKLLRFELHPSALVLEMAVEVMHLLLQTPSSTDIAQCSHLILEVDMKTTGFHIPDAVLRLFYNLAYQLNETKPAETVYEYSQSEAVTLRHRYPSPQGRVLTWLLHHLTFTSRKMHLGRLLAKHVVNTSEPIPLQDRGRFIAIAASNGYSLQARALWERYSVGRDRNTIIGNPATMLRMVSLYASHIRRKERDERVAENADDENKVTSTNQATRDEHEDETADDFTTIAHVIVTEYRKTIEPLIEADHILLTSLARAYFLLGDVASGFEAFRALLDRREVPDLHDINVALSAMAEHTPRGAARMIERMIMKGVQPDPITFGTVIHFATIHRDTELVSTLISRVRQLDNGQLTLKTVSALIQASVEMDSTSYDLLRANLRRAMGIIYSLADSDVIIPPNVGKRCIRAALDVDDPVMAYQFWSVLVRHKIEWADAEHLGSRIRIATLIRDHAKAGLLKADRVKVMLHNLGKEAKFRATRA